ncbi:MAG: hypothetical protein M1269_06735 [Chloroflexi bacterium]|nr:hypothetical protein [Chloroflexota bacterium]
MEILNNEILELKNGRKVRLRQAREADMDEIKHLYYEVYGGSYTLPEINDTDKMRWAIYDPNYTWILCVGDNGTIAGSVIFVVDREKRISKTFAGVVREDYRGSKLLVRILERGLNLVMYEQDLCDSVYGVVRTFAPPGFHEDLHKLGFVDLGIFPNVRRVKKYETHSLKVCYKEGTLDRRRKTPRLIPPAMKIYEIARSKVNLEEALEEAVYLTQPVPGEKIRFLIEKSPDVEWEYYRLRDSGQLIYDFFPFHYPQVMLYTGDRETQVFIHFQERDEHGAILGIKSGGADLLNLLGSINEYAESIGIRYLELLLPAYNPYDQQVAYENGFLPCAYFPAFKLTPGGLHDDYVITSRSFVPLDVKGLPVTEEEKSYLDAYCEIYKDKLWEDIHHEGRPGGEYDQPSRGI